jgi:hypothetical protein
MPFEQTIRRVTEDLVSTFAQLDACFELPSDVRQFQPAEGEWSIDEILEHITLTNHFLMLTLQQSLKKVLHRAQEQSIPDEESQLDRIVQISDPDAFGWIRPEHMEPTRQASSTEIRLRLKTQLETCLQILRQISNGEGSLHRVRMSVQALGKLDMYEWLFFLVQHARRHLTEIDRICQGYEDQISKLVSSSPEINEES